jgi:hypothetical protein
MEWFKKRNAEMRKFGVATGMAVAGGLVAAVVGLPNPASADPGDQPWVNTLGPNVTVLKVSNSVSRASER